MDIQIEYKSVKFVINSRLRRRSVSLKPYMVLGGGGGLVNDVSDPHINQVELFMAGFG